MRNKNKKIGIIDYGVGNLYGLSRAVGMFTKNTVTTEDPKEMDKFDALILPGVGSFESGMSGLRIRNLIDPVKKFAKSGKPILGICLGAQLLLSKGTEFGKFKGLDIISGEVVMIPKINKPFKIPHIGWNKINPFFKDTWKHSILGKIKRGTDVYFVHSFILKPREPKHALAYTDYGELRFCSAIKKDNIYGCQFHPEKSGKAGLQILNNFINL